MKIPAIFLAVSLLALSLSPVQGTIYNMTANLDGAQAGTASAGTGTGLVSYDDATMTLTWVISWSGLTGVESDMHFHGPAAPGVSAGVTVNVGAASNPVSGSATITAGQAAELLNGLWYINLHTSTSGGGEIRGQVLADTPDLQYWPLDETSGIVAPNASFGGTVANLFNGATWVTDAQRGQVLEFDGVDGYATAGMLPNLEPSTNFAWAFWANSSQGENTNVIIGNRYPDVGWIKFTTGAFEYRNIDGSVNETINHPPFAINQWFHHAGTKRGNLLTYYRNGLAMGNQWIIGTLPGPPLYFGGDTVNENWAGRLDDIATWQNNELFPECVVAMADGSANPLDACTFLSAPPMVLTDDFSTGLGNWVITDRGLEQNAPAGFNAPDTTGDVLTLGGTTNNQYWFGSSVESADSFQTSEYSIVNVNRVSLSGTGTAYRSSVWIFGDAGHYLHLSQNIGENGWQYNANDVGGVGTLLPTGGGNNLEGLDALDADGGAAQILIGVVPSINSGEVNIEISINGTVQVIHGFSNFPATYKVILTGQARATGDSVSAVFDNVTVEGTVVQNYPPTFSADPVFLQTTAVGAAYSQDISGSASDLEMDPLTFSKLGGNDWLNVDSNGIITGTPGAGDVGFGAIVVQVDDGNGNTANSTFAMRVEPAVAPTPVLFGWWPLNEGSGGTVADISGNGNTGTIANSATGGLALDGSAWVNDPVCGLVLSFNGDNFNEANPGSWVEMANPLPLIDVNADFTWSFWAKPDEEVSSNIIVGNRYQSVTAGVPTDFAPREFTKFTNNKFEFDTSGGTGYDYADLTQGEWVHMMIVKQDGVLFFYRNGVGVGGGEITQMQVNGQPLFFGGQGGLEVWRGCLSDVRLYQTALVEAQITEIYTNKGIGIVSSEDLLITSITRAPSGAVTINWNGKSGKTYIVEGKRNLSDATWMEITNGQTVSFILNPGNVVLNPATEPQIFLRAREN